jgi:hypothetical protein
LVKDNDHSHFVDYREIRAMLYPEVKWAFAMIYFCHDLNSPERVGIVVREDNPILAYFDIALVLVHTVTANS